MFGRKKTASQENELVTVLTTADMGLLSVAKSILESEGIPYFAKGEDLQGLFVGTIGFVNVQVPAAAEETARTLLSQLT